MKKTAILLLGILMLGMNAYAVKSLNQNATNGGFGTYQTPQVCQFSLTSYSGKIANGCTGRFQVGLSCPQEKDVRATVVVFIDDEHAASKVVTISANNDYSQSTFINVGYDYEGKRYKLVVQ